MLRTSVLVLSAALSFAACMEPKQDDFKSEGGISPDPTGIIAGTVLYSGPRPYCKTDERGRRRVQGRVVLTLFEYDNPPPPEGRAATPLNLKFINAEDLFTVSDCQREGRVADPEGEKITRVASYSWPQIALGRGTDSVRYQMRGFYDTDEDMNLFSVKSLPTEGDIAGAALNDPVDVNKGILAIAMPPAAEAKNGYRRQGVTVSLGNYVWLERPVFKLNEQRFMRADRRVIARQLPNSPVIDIGLTLQEQRAHTCNGRLDCGLSLDQATPEEFDTAFRLGDVQLDYSPEKFAFISEPVDVLTINPDGEDDLRPDGEPDPHPLLGSNLGIPWYTPIVIMSRLAPTQAMTDIETLAGIPGVRLIGSVLLQNPTTPEEGPKPEKRTRLGSIEIAVPPVAAVELDPNNPQCRAPYLAPGNYTRAYESRFTICSDLPTGIYNVAALQGKAGGSRVEAGPEISDTGYVYDGGRFSSQAWTVPNDLGTPAQLRDPQRNPKDQSDNSIVSQSRAGAFVIYDDDLDGQGQCEEAEDTDDDLRVRKIRFRGICEDGQELRRDNPPGSPFEGVDMPTCLPSECCAAVKHLCGVPLCEPCDEESCPGLELGDRQIRQGPTKIDKVVDGKSIPNCLPFPLPALCCE